MSDLNFLNIKAGKNEWWRYILTLLLLFTVGLITSIWATDLILLNIPISLPEGIEGVLNISATIFYALLLLFLSVLVYLVHKRKLITIITSHKQFQWNNLTKGLLIGFIIMSMSSIIMYLIDPVGYEFTFDPNTFGLLLITALIGLSLRGFIEEIFFRGYLLQSFGKITNRPIIPIILTSILFGIIHYSNGINSLHSLYCVICCGISGLTFSVVVLGEGGLETAIGLHIMTNLFLALIVNNPNNWGDLPSLLTAYSESPTDLIGYTSELIYYIIGMVEEIGFMLLTWLFVFWGRLGVLRNVLSFRRSV